MEGQSLEQLLEYQHYNYNPERFEGWDSSHTSGDAVVRLKDNRIIYFWRVSAAGCYPMVMVVVPGILMKKRYRTDSNGNEYSLVKPVPDEAKPELSVAIWEEFIKMPNGIRLQITKFENFRFDYWTYEGVRKQPGQG